MNKLPNIHWRQSFAESLSIVCISILFIFLVAMVIFISYQGGRHFVPANVHLVTIKNTSGVAERHFQPTSSTATALENILKKRFSKQFERQPSLIPVVSVENRHDVIQIDSLGGNVYFGDFVELISPLENNVALEQLDNLLVTTQILNSELNEIQSQKLMPLHRAIAKMYAEKVGENSPALEKAYAEFYRWQSYADSIGKQLSDYKIALLDANGELFHVELSTVRDLTQPNKLGGIDTAIMVVSNIWQFLSNEPKQAATAGGVFPAIFGTLLMVLLMTIVVAPFGMIAAIYLHEYAPANRTTELIRIGISNMAAVPSVVYGVFGLGFFVYTLGGSIDQLLYSNNLPSPTFGTPGLLWASLTMGLLTLPVVIVSAEEGLRRVPSGLREGSYALGATKLETIQKVVLPMASPGMLTGIILAIARAAGEVAPLILVGAVKFAPNLPIDSEFPYVHLERQFMHLGVFIYDGAFHNQIESPSSSMMFASCMLLLLMVFLLNISAILFRKRLRDKYERSHM
ncbi:phosphate ABC transporter permease PstA [Agaribacter marinus]|nr:phosphate ABC transporter permease PstA [Agaribacter marinus]